MFCYPNKWSIKVFCYPKKWSVSVFCYPQKWSVWVFCYPNKWSVKVVELVELKTRSSHCVDYPAGVVIISICKVLNVYKALIQNPSSNCLWHKKVSPKYYPKLLSFYFASFWQTVLYHIQVHRILQMSKSDNCLCIKFSIKKTFAQLINVETNLNKNIPQTAVKTGKNYDNIFTVGAG